MTFDTNAIAMSNNTFILLVTGLLSVLLIHFETEPTKPAVMKENSATKFSTVIVYCDDISAMADFYQNGLSLEKPATVLEHHIGFWLDDNYLGFEPAETSLVRPGAVSAWFATPDIKHTYQRLLKLGGRSVDPPSKQQYGGTHARIADPEGNVVGLIEME